MLSIANISSSGAALSYYEEDDYYSQGSIDHQNSSNWLGQGAKQLGLTGQVDKENFKNVLEGKLPDGTLLGQKKGDEVKHAVGIDMTFSAPKSVSILSEVLGEEKIHQLHQKAVENTLKYAEDNFIATRVKDGKKVVKQQVKSMIAATFMHNTSRNLDPQLHTHCVIANIVKRNDGNWRSAWFGEIFDNKKLLGCIYRAELAKELVKEGYEINRTHNDGRFEVAGVPKDLIDAFSSRSKEIKEALEQYNFKNAKTAADATMRTREAKKVYDREVLEKMWQEVLAKQGYSKDSLLKVVSINSESKIFEKTENIGFLEEKWQKFVQFLGINKPRHVSEDTDSKDLSSKEIAKKSIEYAIEHLGEKESIFAKKEIMLNALSYGIGEVKIEDLVKNFEKFEEKGLIFHSNKQNLESFYTTAKALETEAASILMMKNGRNKVEPIAQNQEKTVEYLAKTSLNKNQRNAAEFILFAKDKVVAIQGYAGVGKTYTLNVIREVAKKNGYDSMGMAPSASAALTLQNEAKIPSQTIHKFLFQYDGLINGRGTKQGLEAMKLNMKNKIIVLDEASLSSTNQVNSLLKVVEKLDLRLIMVGDVKQLDSVEAGKPFYQLQKAGMKTVVMDEIIRQKDLDLKSSVESITKGEIIAAFERFSNSKNSKIIEENKVNRIAEVAVAEYFKLSAQERKNTLILTPANETRAHINDIIRNILQNDGLLGKSFLNTETMKQRDFSQVEKTKANNYMVGEVVLFNKSYKSLGIKKGDYMEIIKIEQGQNIIHLRNNDKIIEWNPEKVGAKRMGVVEIFTKNKIELRVGDKVMFTKNSKKIPEILNSGVGFVVGIKEDGKIIFDLENNKKIELSSNNSELKHIDYGYATTVHSAQGKTADNVIAIAESYREHLLNQKSFYVTISRARDKVMLIVDDKQKVADKLFEYTGEKVSALESQNIHERHIDNNISLHHHII